jgi:hypothetical protein
MNMRFWPTGTESALETALASAAKIAELALRRRLPTLTDFAGPFFAAGALCGLCWTS